MCNTDSGDRRWALFSWLLNIFCLLLLLLLLLLVVLRHNIIQLYGLWLCDELLLNVKQLKYFPCHLFASVVILVAPFTFFNVYLPIDGFVACVFCVGCSCICTGEDH